MVADELERRLQEGGPDPATAMGGSDQDLQEPQVRVVELRRHHLCDPQHVTVLGRRERQDVREDGRVAQCDRGRLERPVGGVRPTERVRLLAGSPETTQLLVVMYV